MPTLTPDGQTRIAEIARRHGFSADAATTLFKALVTGHGTQAQFSHPELGGMGQWSQGGMLMIGDMFNTGLKGRVGALCDDLAPMTRSDDVFTVDGTGNEGGSRPGAADRNWWPSDLGQPSTSGAQNDLHYAFFPAMRRLAIRRDGRVIVYDSGDHAISGVSQQQGSSQSLSFSSQSGRVDLDTLRIVSQT